MLPLFALLLLSLTASSESSVVFSSFCPQITFNEIFNKYEIAIPISSRVKAGDLEVSAAAALASKDSGLSVSFQAKSSRSGVVSLLCKTYQRCWELKAGIGAKPEILQKSIRFYSPVSVSQSSLPVKVPSRSLVRSNCNSGWKVFQRRVDSSLSFAQNYKTYERGFGDPRGNYWMGLHNLHAATVAGTHTSPCRFRVRAFGDNGRHYKAEYTHFQVLHSKLQYKLLLSGPVKGNTINRIHYHNGKRFTTYDRDQDSYKGQCSQIYGYGGWWYGACHTFNPNGAYTRRNLNDPTFSCMGISGRSYQSIRSITMEYKCE